MKSSRISQYSFIVPCASLRGPLFRVLRSLLVRCVALRQFVTGAAVSAATTAKHHIPRETRQALKYTYRNYSV